MTTPYCEEEFEHFRSDDIWGMAVTDVFGMVRGPHLLFYTLITYRFRVWIFLTLKLLFSTMFPVICAHSGSDLGVRVELLGLKRRLFFW